MDPVESHYARPDLLEKIRAGLKALGKAPESITPRDLAAVDQLHTGGAPATIALMKKWLSTGSRPEQPVILDTGCGTGGSSRLLAEQFNCRMTGIDLSKDFIATAETLTRWCGLEETVSFRQGSILNLPFEDGSFDAVLCQHLLLNIEGKQKALEEFHRVLRPEGSLILHEITRGEGPEPLLPVPWAKDRNTSFLVSWTDMESLLGQAGFSLDWHRDETEDAARWWQKNNAAAGKRSRPPALHPGLVFGKNARQFGPNMERNFFCRAVCCMAALGTKAGPGV